MPLRLVAHRRARLATCSHNPSLGSSPRLEEPVSSISQRRALPGLPLKLPQLLIQVLRRTPLILEIFDQSPRTTCLLNLPQMLLHNWVLASSVPPSPARASLARAVLLKQARTSSALVGRTPLKVQTRRLRRSRARSQAARQACSQERRLVATQHLLLTSQVRVTHRSKINRLDRYRARILSPPLRLPRLRLPAQLHLHFKSTGHRRPRIRPMLSLMVPPNQLLRPPNIQAPSPKALRAAAQTRPNLIQRRSRCSDLFVL